MDAMIKCVDDDDDDDDDCLYKGIKQVTQIHKCQSYAGVI